MADPAPSLRLSDDALNELFAYDAQAALHDQVVPLAEARAFHQAGSEPKRIIWYDAGHRLNAAAIRDQIAWLEQHIGIDPDKVEGTFSRA